MLFLRCMSLYPFSMWFPESRFLSSSLFNSFYSCLFFFLLQLLFIENRYSQICACFKVRNSVFLIARCSHHQPLSNRTLFKRPSASGPIKCLWPTELRPFKKTHYGFRSTENNQISETRRLCIISKARRNCIFD